MQRYNVLVQVPEGTDIRAKNPDGSFVLGNDLAQILDDLFVEFPAGVALGTVPVGGRQLTHATLKMSQVFDVDEVEVSPKILLDLLIQTFSLDWVVGAMRHFSRTDIIMPAEPWVIDYIAPRYIFDINGVLSVDPSARGINEISKYFGQAPWEGS